MRRVALPIGQEGLGSLEEQRRRGPRPAHRPRLSRPERHSSASSRERPAVRRALPAARQGIVPAAVGQRFGVVLRRRRQVADHLAGLAQPGAHLGQLLRGLVREK